MTRNLYFLTVIKLTQRGLHGISTITHAWQLSLPYTSLNKGRCFHYRFSNKHLNEFRSPGMSSLVITDSLQQLSTTNQSNLRHSDLPPSVPLSTPHLHKRGTPTRVNTPPKSTWTTPQTVVRCAEHLTDTPSFEKCSYQQPRSQGPKPSLQKKTTDPSLAEWLVQLVWNEPLYALGTTFHSSSHVSNK